jgi:NADH-quinone oxidoreductase subunit L
VPEFLGGNRAFHHWLQPVFEHGHDVAHAAHGAHDLALEWTLMTASVLIAGFGAFIAYMIYYRGAWSADAIAGVGGGAPYQLVYNKYWVDEIYWATFGKGTLALSRAAAWFDANVIDGIVNATATVTRAIARVEGAFDNRVVDAIVNILANRTYDLGSRLRRVQTGSINAYLYVIVGTVTLVLIARLL